MKVMFNTTTTTTQTDSTSSLISTNNIYSLFPLLVAILIFFIYMGAIEKMFHVFKKYSKLPKFAITHAKKVNLWFFVSTLLIAVVIVGGVWIGYAIKQDNWLSYLVISAIAIVVIPLAGLWVFLKQKRRIDTLKIENTFDFERLNTSLNEKIEVLEIKLKDPLSVSNSTVSNIKNLYEISSSKVKNFAKCNQLSVYVKKSLWSIYFWNSLILNDKEADENIYMIMAAIFQQVEQANSEFTAQKAAEWLQTNWETLNK
ncbi:hypothetical protein [Mycoplasmopsis columbinasalis]|uniref:Uncharacterized protein n=1 Tax=Mycoplasmopsis columbinasalis TaxID=114880 RepID=A0A449B9N4_9BACT|nr:hypothetical protein [Mycoplasmopsis columbinasalis]VEU77876.1 Uncharacterised protein [Mycoplasmopsis columbinasalis]